MARDCHAGRCLGLLQLLSVILRLLPVVSIVAGCKVIETNIDSLSMDQKGAHMTRILVAVGVALLLTNSSSAQSYCDQVKQAIASYGYAAAKRHALAHYSKEEVKAADRCVTGRHRSVRRIKT